MTWGRFYWPPWLLIVLVSFLVAEIYALASGQPANTLSNWIWQQLNISGHTSFRNWSAKDYLTFLTYISVFVLWLPWHFWFHRFT